MGLFDSIKTTNLVTSIFADSFKSVMKEEKLMKKIGELDQNGVFNEEEKDLLKQYRQLQKRIDNVYKRYGCAEAEEKQKPLVDEQEEVFAKLVGMLHADANIPDDLKKMLNEYTSTQEKMKDRMVEKTADLVAKDAGARTKEEKEALRKQIREELK